MKAIGSKFSWGSRPLKEWQTWGRKIISGEWRMYKCEVWGLLVGKWQVIEFSFNTIRMCLGQDQSTFPMQGWTINVLGFVGHVVSVVTTEPCHCSVKADRQYANKWIWLCSHKTSFTKIGDGPNLTQGLQVSGPGPGTNEKTRINWRLMPHP